MNLWTVAPGAYPIDIAVNPVTWSANWGTDSLIMGENFILSVPLEGDAGTTNNLGLGTPFAGNLTVYPVYRINPTVQVRPLASGTAAYPDFISVYRKGNSQIIRYSVSLEAPVSIKVYDMRGKQVATLVNR